MTGKPQSAGPIKPPTRIAFTIVSANYLAYAATLMQSLRAHDPDLHRVIVLADLSGDFGDIDFAAEILPCARLPIPMLSNMQAWYSVMEFNTALKPFAFQYFMDRGAAEICYIDPDIMLFSPLTAVHDALRVKGHDIVLTPHILAPLEDGCQPDDLTIMKSGVYNLGFLGVSNTPSARVLIDWWARRCLADCRVDIPGHVFTDQRWMDMAPVFTKNPFILRDPGYNVAYWNLAHRKLDKRGKNWLVNGQKLVFFHFSGIVPDKDDVLSKHQNRLTLDDIGAAKTVFTEYRAQLIANRWAELSKIRYGFDLLPDGTRLDQTMRRYLAQAAASGTIDKAAPLKIDAGYFAQSEPDCAHLPVKLSRYAYQFWRDRPDLQAMFDLRHDTGASRYRDWFLAAEAVRQGADPGQIEAQRQLAVAVKLSPLALAAAAKLLPPWPPISASCAPPPARDAETWLARSVVFTTSDGATHQLPRAAALLWEQRPDLQQSFALRDDRGVRRYLGWVLTTGFAEGGMTPQNLGADFIAAMTALTSENQEDVPLTVAMTLVRPPLPGAVLERFKLFPHDRIGRLSHGFWFAFCAPRLWHWPDALTAPVKHYFQRPAAIACDGFVFNQAMLAILDFRADIKEKFKISDQIGALRYLRWLVMIGAQEIGFDVNDLHPGLCVFLNAPSPRIAGLSLMQELLIDARADLAAKFNVRTEEGRRQYLQWCHTHGAHIFAALAPPVMAPPAEPMAVKLILAGQYTAPSGRGEDIRGTISGFAAIEYGDYLIADLVSGRLHRPDGEMIPENTAVTAEKLISYMNADTAVRDFRKLAAMRVWARYYIGFWAWELARLPPYWRIAFGYFDEIWAATSFAETAFAAENLRPVRRMAMAVEVPARPGRVALAALRENVGFAAGETVFLFMFDFRSYVSRKNPGAVIAAFLRCFGNSTDKVRLVIKTQGADSDKPAYDRLLAQCRDPRIDIRDGEMPRDAVMALLMASDVFVSLHRSEGFGRGPAEAMALGKPVILTNYSGSCDFADSSCAYPIAYDLIPVEPDSYPGAIGPDGSAQLWADASVVDAAKQMRAVIEAPGEASRRASLAAQRIATLYGKEQAARALLAALDTPMAVPDGKTAAGNVQGKAISARR